ncbi:hypothetical protein AB0D11_28675 [Streptomyces monashensis]|uniref:hypothetical protein n=1 Tax=Streptomyces monashensis TaxID=1678012 RepID=UPI0033D7CC30
MEATVHHLDLTAALPHATLDGLLGRPELPQRSDGHDARVGTAPGPTAGRFPLFG